jgi:2-methylisocitrate lyase-like PEP mutase family enzyme
LSQPKFDGLCCRHSKEIEREEIGMNMRKRLRQLLNGKDIVVAPGVGDGLSARLVEQAGFGAVYASGGAISRAAGYPDLGLLGMTEMAERLAAIVDVTDIPVIADADTGFGNGLNVRRTTRRYERLGVAGFHIEDQQFPKRCGHLDDKSLVGIADMCLKIRVARDSLIDPDLLIIARTDAIAVEGFEQALERARAYLDAGADMIFVEAPESVQQIEEIAKAIPQPKLINMFYGGKTPLVPRERLQALGYKLIIIPSDLQRAAIRAMQKALAAIAASGDSAALAAELVSFAEREKIVGAADWLALDRMD